MTYHRWVEQEAELIHADGCTGVTNWNAICCLQHDLEFYYGRSAVDAYVRWRNNDPTPWLHAVPTTYDAANSHFKACNFRETALGYWNPFAWVRYSIGRLRKTRSAWDHHRKARPVETV